MSTDTVVAPAGQTTIAGHGGHKGGYGCDPSFGAMGMLPMMGMLPWLLMGRGFGHDGHHHGFGSDHAALWTLAGQHREALHAGLEGRFNDMATAGIMKAVADVGERSADRIGCLTASLLKECGDTKALLLKESGDSKLMLMKEICDTKGALLKEVFDGRIEGKENTLKILEKLCCEFQSVRKDICDTQKDIQHVSKDICEAKDDIKTDLLKERLERDRFKIQELEFKLACRHHGGGGQGG